MLGALWQNYWLLVGQSSEKCQGLQDITGSVHMTFHQGKGVGGGSLQVILAIGSSFTSQLGRRGEENWSQHTEALQVPVTSDCRYSVPLYIVVQYFWLCALDGSRCILLAVLQIMVLLVIAVPAKVQPHQGQFVLASESCTMAREGRVGPNFSPLNPVFRFALPRLHSVLGFVATLASALSFLACALSSPGILKPSPGSAGGMCHCSYISYPSENGGVCVVCMTQKCKILRHCVRPVIVFFIYLYYLYMSLCWALAWQMGRQYEFAKS